MVAQARCGGWSTREKKWSETMPFVLRFRIGKLWVRSCRFPAWSVRHRRAAGAVQASPPAGAGCAVGGFSRRLLKKVQRRPSRRRKRKLSQQRFRRDRFSLQRLFVGGAPKIGGFYRESMWWFRPDVGGGLRCAKSGPKQCLLYYSFVMEKFGSEVVVSRRGG